MTAEFWGRRSDYGGDGGRPDRPPIERAVLVLSIGAIGLLIFAYRAGWLSQFRALQIGLLIPAVIIHEISHGLMALRFGDQTAKLSGRLSFNPLRHVDPIGTVVVPAVLIAMSAPVFGWAKPVPVNTSRMSDTQSMLVSLAGPASNILLALLAAGAVHSVMGVDEFYRSDAMQWVWVGLVSFGVVNVVLAVFNLLPMPPLDGSEVLRWILPKSAQEVFDRIRPYSLVILLVIMLSGVLNLNSVFDPAIDLWFRVAGLGELVAS